MISNITLNRWRCKFTGRGKEGSWDFCLEHNYGYDCHSWHVAGTYCIYKETTVLVMSDNNSLKMVIDNDLGAVLNIVRNSVTP